MSTKDAAKTTLQRSKLRFVLSQLRNEFLSENRHSKIQDSETIFLGEDGRVTDQGNATNSYMIDGVSASEQL